MLFDTHAHLTQCKLPLVPPYPVISVSTNLADSKSNIVLCRSFKHAYPAVGLHPWFVSEKSIEDLSELLILIKSEQIKLVGEIGLDFSSNFRVSKQLQLEVFERQLAWAVEYDCAVSMHIYKAYDDAYDLLKTYPVKGCLHGFAGGYQQAERFVKLGLKIGVNATILKDNARRYHQLVQMLDLESLLLETDAPNIAYPTTRPGDLAMIEQVAQKVAELKQCSLEQVAEITTQNALESFNLEFIK
jgi:TatD DNase family protein